MLLSNAASAVKIKHNVRGLDVIQAVYAFAMALGLTQVFTGSQTFLTRTLSGTAPLAEDKTILVLLLFANVAMLGLRFFWAPRNLQSLVITSAKCLAVRRGKGDISQYLANSTIAYHMVAIFLHGALFYLACSEFEFVVFSISSNLPLNPSVFVGYLTMHASLLLLNALWIALIRRQEQRLEMLIYSADEVERRASAGNVWWRNNLIASLVAIAPFAISSTCRSQGTQCIETTFPAAPWSSFLFPTSPQIFATIYYDISNALTWLGMQAANLPVYWVLVVFLVNSAYDLLNAGKYYVIFDDVEWETTVATQHSDEL